MDNNNYSISKRIVYIAVALFMLLIVAFIIILLKSNYNLKLAAGEYKAELGPAKSPTDSLSQKLPNASPEAPHNRTDKTTTKILPLTPSTKVKNQDTEPTKRATVETGSNKVNVENQPANITTGPNSPIITGNDNNVEYNTMRKLGDEEKKSLIVMLNEEFKKNGIDYKTGCVDIMVPAANDNPDSYFLSSDIEKFLTEKGYNVTDKGLQQISNIQNKGYVTINYMKGFDCVFISVWLATK